MQIGYAALQILIQIVIADCTNLRWRGLISSLTSIWFFVNAFVSSNIAQGVLTTSNWHWGYAMFIILIPVTIAPIAGTLFWAQHRVRLQRFPLSRERFLTHASAHTGQEARPRLD